MLSSKQHLQITGLIFHFGAFRVKRVKKQKLKDLELSYEVLRKLEVALRTNPAAWVEEFCDYPNNGHIVLIEFMEDLPRAVEAKLQGLAQRLPVSLLPAVIDRALSALRFEASCFC